MGSLARSTTEIGGLEGGIFSKIHYGGALFVIYDWFWYSTCGLLFIRALGNLVRAQYRYSMLNKSSSQPSEFLDPQSICLEASFVSRGPRSHLCPAASRA